MKTFEVTETTTTRTIRVFTVEAEDWEAAEDLVRDSKDLEPDIEEEDENTTYEVEEVE